MDFTSFDILFRIFFVFFAFWLLYGSYRLYNYIVMFRKIKCILCNESESINSMYRCRKEPKHKFHKKCFENNQYHCNICEKVEPEIVFSDFV